jgi:hypothetical protein
MASSSRPRPDRARSPSTAPKGIAPTRAALADVVTTRGEKPEDVSKSVRRQVRLTTGEQQIPWESTSLELDFYFVPPAPPPSPAAHLLAAADETGNAALFDPLIERFPGSIRSRRCQGRAGQAASPRAQ